MILWLDMFFYIDSKLLLCRSHDDSFARGILTTESYDYGVKRRIVSLKICFVSWLLEFAGVLLTLLTPLLRGLGFHYLYYFDAVLMFIVIPFIHLMNDEDTKTIITENGWLQGIQHMIRVKQDETR